MKAKILLDNIIKVISWLNCKLKTRVEFYGLTHTLFFWKKIDFVWSIYELGIKAMKSWMSIGFYYNNLFEVSNIMSLRVHLYLDVIRLALSWSWKTKTEVSLTANAKSLTLGKTWLISTSANLYLITWSRNNISQILNLFLSTIFL